MMDTRTKVLIAAADLFASRGYYQVSVREICDAAGVTKPMLYYYFKDKDDLLRNLVTEVHTHFEKLYNEFIKPEESFEKNLEGLYQSYLKYALNYPYLIKLSALVFFSPLPDEIKKMSAKRSKELRQFILGVFDKGKKEGLIDENVNLEVVALSFLGPVIILLTSRILVPEPDRPVLNMLDEYFDFWKKKILKHDIKPE